MIIEPPAVVLGPKACATLVICFHEWRDAWIEEHGTPPVVPDEVTEAIEEMILCVTYGDPDDDEDDLEAPNAKVLALFGRGAAVTP